MPHRAKRSVFTQQATRGLVLLAAYALICALCRYVAYELRFDFIVPQEYQVGRITSIAINLPLKLGCLYLFGQFSTMLSYFSLPDLVRLAGAMLSANVVSYLVWGALFDTVITPRGVVLVDFVLCVCAIGVFRLGLRMYRERMAAPRNGESGDRRQQKIAIVGAGDAGATQTFNVQRSTLNVQVSEPSAQLRAPSPPPSAR
jgi:FlaA1/EpsC-like NDP-sugar epimerase